jgi:hypothetical protein
MKTCKKARFTMKKSLKVRQEMGMEVHDEDCKNGCVWIIKLGEL